MDKNNNVFSIFSQNISNIKQEKENDMKEHSSNNEERILTKLSLRKKKISEKISSKRFMNISSTLQSLNITKNLKNISYTKENFTSGEIYTELLIAYNSKNEEKIKEIIVNIISYFADVKINNLEFTEILLNSGINNKENSDTKFPLATLILNIGINTKDKSIYIYCFNFVLNFSFISNEFCREITNEYMVSIISDKLSEFYPLFMEDKIELKENFYLNEFNPTEIAEAYHVGSQILKLLGNLYLSVDTYECFEIINFYNKICYLLYIFKYEENCKKYNNIFSEYLETLIWLINMFYIKNENLVVNYGDKLLMIIPCLFNDIKSLYFTQNIDILEKIIALIDYISDINREFLEQIVDSDAINILTNLFGYLFKESYQETDEIVLNSDIISKILGIFINIFTLDSKDLKNVDFLNFSIVLQKLFSLYKVHHTNHFELQRKLIIILSNLACFEDISDIVTKIILNGNILKDLFNYYYTFHKSEVILFIDNVMEKQHKNIRDFILEMGAKDIIKNNICEYDKNMIDIVKGSIQILYKLIKAEKAFNIRLLFEKIYNTSIPERIKELVNDENMNDIDIIIHFIVSDFETYEKSIQND